MYANWTHRDKGNAGVTIRVAVYLKSGEPEVSEVSAGSPRVAGDKFSKAVMEKVEALKSKVSGGGEGGGIGERLGERMLAHDPLILLTPLAFHFLELGFAHHGLDARGEMTGHAADPADPIAERPQYPRQVLGADEDQREDRDDRELG